MRHARHGNAKNENGHGLVAWHAMSGAARRSSPRRGNMSGTEKLFAVGRRLSTRRRKARRASRRGVLLLVVLSMLVLFMLIGTAFLMSSSQQRDSAKASAKATRLDKLATKRLEVGLLTVVRDTEDPHSVIRYHSLLRDLYGTDGFQAVAASACYARQITPTSDPAYDNTNLGRTLGQFIDIY